MNLEDAVELLRRHELQAFKRSHYINGARRIESLEGPEDLIRLHDPYQIVNIDDSWFASVDAGQRALPIKVSKSVKEVTWTIINLFNMYKKQSDDKYMFLDALVKLIVNNFIVEVISQTDIAVYVGGDGFDDHFKEYELALTSATFKKNALVAVIQTTDQGLTVGFGSFDQLSTPEPVPNMEAAANLIIDRQK
jgi:hypothetical protein